MKHEDKMIEALASMPFNGAKLDEEPYPIGEVVGVDEAKIEARWLKMLLQDRRTDETEEVVVLAVYVDDQPVLVTRAAE